MKRIYVETSVISFLTGAHSQHHSVAQYQKITNFWWKNEISRYDCFISDIVIDEISHGDTGAALKRLHAVESFKKLPLTGSTFDIIMIYKRVLNFPERASLDLFHLAIATMHHIDYILSWDCRHIVNERTQEIIAKIAQKEHLFTPRICTPLQLHLMQRR